MVSLVVLSASWRIKLISFTSPLLQILTTGKNTYCQLYQIYNPLATPIANMSVLCYNAAMTEQSFPEEPKNLGFQRSSLDGIGDQAGVSIDDAREQGILTPAQERTMGISAVEGSSLLDENEVNAELGMIEPTIATINKWSDDASVLYTSDGRAWLCALDEDDKPFIKVPATNSVGNDNEILHKHVGNLLSDLYEKAA